MESLKTLALPGREWLWILQSIEHSIDVLENNNLDSSDLETVVVRLSTMLQGYDLTKEESQSSNSVGVEK